jgi:hypothetical protein
MHEHLNALRVKNYSEYTIKNRLVHIGFFIAWLKRREIAVPRQIRSNATPCCNRRKTSSIRLDAVMSRDAS